MNNRIVFDELGRNRLVTAEIIYRLPDHRSILQSFLWQTADIVPGLPRLEEFLAFWEREIEGPIHSVRVAHIPLLDPRDLRHASKYLLLH